MEQLLGLVTIRRFERLAQAGFDLFGVIPAAPAVHLEQAVPVHAALHRRRPAPAGVKVLWAASAGLSRFAPLAFAHTRGFTVFSPGPKTGRVGLQPATALLSALQSATGAGSRLGSRCAAGLAENIEDEEDADGGEGRNRGSLARFTPRQLVRACAGVFKPTKADPGEKRPRGSRSGSRLGAVPDKLFIKSYSYRRSKMDPAEPGISVMRATRLSGKRA